MAAPTPISALVHSSTLVTAGVYLFIRFEFLFKSSNFFSILLLVLVGLTILIAGLGALSELDIKKIIAYSTLSQLGLIMIVVILGNDIFSFFHILTHALFKALLFLCSGVLIHRACENQDIRCYNYTMKLDLFVVCVFFICRMSLAGFPFLSGFYSKDLILEIVYLNNYNLFYFLLLLINTALTGVYSFRVVYYRIMLGSKNFKLIFYGYWDRINNSLFYLFIGVIVRGRSVYYILLDKFEIIFLLEVIKIINIFLFFLSFIIFYFLYVSVDLFSKKFTRMYFLTIFYISRFQGFIFNKVYKNSLIYSVYFEFVNEFLFFKRFSYFVENLLNIFLFLKIFTFYFSVLLLPIVILVCFINY